MTGKQRITSSPFQAFLPDGAIIMARMTRTARRDALTNLAPSPGSGCSGTPLKILGTGNAPLAFILEAPLRASADPETQSDDQSDELLFKMIAALGIKSGEALVLEISHCCGTPESHLPSEIKKSLPRNIAGLVAMGDFARRMTGGLPQGVTVTRHPMELIKNPEFKSGAWSDLQTAARAAGMEIPKRKS